MTKVVLSFFFKVSNFLFSGVIYIVFITLLFYYNSKSNKTESMLNLDMFR